MGKMRIETTTNNSKKRSLRLVLIASEETVSDNSLFLEHLLVGLADESIPVALVCPIDSDVDLAISGPVEIISYPALKLPLMERLNRKRLIEQLSKFNPTVLYCLCESKASFTRQLSRKLELPYVLTVNSLKNKWSNLHISNRRCAKIIVPANSIAANLTKTHPRFADRITQINIGTFIREQIGCFRKSSQLVSLVTACTSYNIDDYENLFNAVRHLLVERYEFLMAVISNGRAEKQLRKLITALGLWQIVTIIPKMKPWHSILAAGDIFIQPVSSKIFNHLLLEAMSVGSAVASCKGGVDDLIIEDKTAVVFDPHDELSIYGCLQRLFDKPEFARKIAKTAQQYLRENHSVSSMISATLRTLYEAQQWLSH